MGAQLRVYRQKIRSASTTKKITRAMELISASRIQKAQARMTAATPYTRAVTRAVSAVATYSNIDHPLLTESENPKRAAMVIFTSDRGLAGAFSAQVLREAGELRERLESEGKEVVNFVVGRKAVQNFTFRQRPVEKSWTGNTDQPEFETAKEIAQTLIEKFTTDQAEGGVDEIHIVYNRFVSLVTQAPEVVRVLPLEVVEGVEEPGDTEVFPLYEFEPEPDDVLDALLPVYIENRIFTAMLQSAAAEHAARQKAMKSASDNADKLIREYTSLANNARQAGVFTDQLVGVVTGRLHRLLASSVLSRRGLQHGGEDSVLDVDRKQSIQNIIGLRLKLIEREHLGVTGLLNALHNFEWKHTDNLRSLGDKGHKTVIDDVDFIHPALCLIRGELLD